MGETEGPDIAPCQAKVVVTPDSFKPNFVKSLHKLNYSKFKCRLKLTSKAIRPYQMDGALT